MTAPRHARAFFNAASCARARTDGEVDRLAGLGRIHDLARDVLPADVRLALLGDLQQVRAHVGEGAQLARAADVDRPGERAGPIRLATAQQLPERFDNGGRFAHRLRAVPLEHGSPDGRTPGGPNLSTASRIISSAAGQLSRVSRRALASSNADDMETLQRNIRDSRHMVPRRAREASGGAYPPTRALIGI